MDWGAVWEAGKPVAELVFTLLGGSLAGWAGAVLRFRGMVSRHKQAVTKLVNGSEQRLNLEFTKLREALGQGLKLELNSLKEQVSSEIRRMEAVERDVRDVREKSGDYTAEADFSRLEQRVQQWMIETSSINGRVLQALSAMEKEQERAKMRSRPPKE